MLTRRRTTLILGLLLALAFAGSAQALGTSSPAILDPVSSTPVYAGFTGPYEVDFSNSPAGAYQVQVSNAGSAVVRGPIDYTATGNETRTFSLPALPAGTFTLQVVNAAHEVATASLTFTVRAGKQPHCYVNTPRQVRVNSGQEVVTGTLLSNCAAAHVTYAGWDVRHSSGAFHDLMTFDHKTRDSFSFFGSNRLGTYRVTPTEAENPAADDVLQNSLDIDVRLDSRLRLKAVRSGGYVTLTATLTKFVRTSRTFTSWKSQPVHLYERACSTCPFEAVNARRTNSRGFTIFRVKAPASHTFMVTSPSTSVIWSPAPAYAR